MIISNECLTNSTISHRTNTHEAPDFADFLKNPAHDVSGGNYYQQHQQQWQPSALHFLAQQHKPATTTKTPEQRTVEPKATETLNCQHPITQCPQNTVPAPDVPQCESGLETTLTALPQLIAPKETPKAIPLDGQRKTTPATVDCDENPHTKVCLPEAHAFKKYRLHVAKNEVELSLNSAALEKEALTAFKKSIKQWMREKGLYLKQLIINGEPQ